jgi:hypothetical protein
MMFAATVHEATLIGDQVEWETRTFDCDAGGPPSFRTSLVTPVERVGGAVRLAPPFVRREAVQAVSFRDRDLVFVPNEDLAPHRTRHGFEVLHPDHGATDGFVRCLQKHGIEPSSSMLLVAWPADRPDPPVLEGKFARKHEGERSLVAASAAVFVAGVFGLVLALRRLERRVRFEAAEAILRADMPDL